MADHAIVISTSDRSLTTASTLLNTALAAEIVAVSPQPLQVINLCSLYNTDATAYGLSVMLKFQG